MRWGSVFAVMCRVSPIALELHQRPAGTTAPCGVPWAGYPTPRHPVALSDLLDAACERAGFQRRWPLRTEQGPSALNLSRAGLGVTLLPGNVVPPGFGGVVLHPDPPVERRL